MIASGVIEGFYGRAWSAAQRMEMMDWIVAAGMTCFIYAPKDDIKLRAAWRVLYDDAELAALKDLATAASSRGLDLMVALAPCLDIVYSDPREIDAIVSRLDQLVEIGIFRFVLLYDDIPHRLVEADRARFSSFAEAQCHVVNAVAAHLDRVVPNGKLLFCPTEYCGALAVPDVPCSPYLKTIGERLASSIGIFWTGPDIVSETITAASIREIGAILGRRPVIWDNFHANDYDIRRVHAGPLGGRSCDLLPLIDGIVTNPNNEFEANFVAVKTTGAWVGGAYDEASAFAAALAQWQPRFALAHAEPRETLPLEDIRLLAELFHQPFRNGPAIENLLAVARALLGERRPDVRSERWLAGRARVLHLRDRLDPLFDALTRLENRELFHTFQPYLWEAREEVKHITAYLDLLAEDPPEGAAFPHEDRIDHVYRRGFTASIQALFPRGPDGTYHHGP